MRILRYLKPYRHTVYLALFIKFTASAAELLLPYVLSYIIDDLVPLKDASLIFIFGGVMLLCSLVAVFGNIIANRLSAISSGKMTHDLRYDLFCQVSRLNCDQVDHFTLPSLISRLSSDSYNINSTVARMMRMGVRAPILLIGGIAITLILDYKLALVLLAMIPIIGLVVFLITRKTIPAFLSVQSCVDNMIRRARENITGIRVIKALSKTDYERHRFHSTTDELAKREFSTDRLNSVTSPLTTLILNIGLVLVIVVGAMTNTQAGVILAFLSYFTMILNAVIGVTRIFTILSKGLASSERVLQVLETDTGLPVLDHTEASAGNPDSAIQFDHVHFSYNKVADDLSDIHFTLMPGQTLGIIGTTGSGKTTLVHLLMRLYEADSGHIFVGGRDIRTYAPQELRSKFGIAFQNDFLMADSIYENVSYGRNLSETQVLKALEYSQAKEFVDKLPEGIQYKVAQKAGNLSGGQKQRLILARALAGNPEYLILDDSSSALDYKTDTLLRQSIRDHFPDTTTILISQRISTIQDADLILVMDNGKIIGAGTHDELITSCEDYAQICHIQGGDL